MKAEDVLTCANCLDGQDVSVGDRVTLTSIMATTVAYMQELREPYMAFQIMGTIWESNQILGCLLNGIIILMAEAGGNPQCGDNPYCDEDTYYCDYSVTSMYNVPCGDLTLSNDQDEIAL